MGISSLVGFRGSGTACRGKGLGRICLAAALLCLALPLPARTQDGAEEYQVKAAFLFHFARFVEWPAQAFPDSSAPIRMCVLGNDPFDGALEETVKGKTVQNRSLAIDRVKPGPALASCHILFISSGEMKKAAATLAAIKDAHVLTVGETERILDADGAIALLMEENKLKFEVNLDAAERAGLKISSKLLALAKSIRSNAPARTPR